MSWSNGESSRSRAHGCAARRGTAFAHAGAVRALPAARAVIPVVLVVAAAATTVASAARAPRTPAQTTRDPNVSSRVLESYLLTGRSDVFRIGVAASSVVVASAALANVGGSAAA